MNKRKKNSEEEELDRNAWMVTFSDLLTLMLTFFVMLLTMSTVDPIEVKEYFSIFDSLYYEEGEPETQEIESYGVFNTKGGSPVKDARKGGLLDMPFKYVSSRTVSKDADELEALLAKLALDAETKFTGFSEQEANELNNIVVKKNLKGITVSLPDSLFFKAADTEIIPRSIAILKLLGNWVQKKPYAVKIEGHSDNAKVESKEFPSNWELSVARATNIMRYFIDNKFIVDSKRISAFGYSEFQPLVRNDSFENRKKNRRIEVIFDRPKV